MAWSLPRRVAFRFGVVVAAIEVLPFPLDSLPKTDWIVGKYGELWDWLTRAFAGLVGIEIPPTIPTGSGDTTAAYTQVLLQLALGVLGAALWSAIDEPRRPTSYPRTARVVVTALRYWLAFEMFSYGFAKVFHTQFPAPRVSTLEHPVGEMSPMGLLWTFMGYSTAYNVFAGLAECIGGALLLWRRTTTLGALILIGVMTNVVMLNFSYDVPVKLFSATLLVIAVVLVAPDMRRIAGALFGLAVPARVDYARWSPRWERIRIAVKLALVGVVLGSQVYGFLDRPNLQVPPHGLYDVDRFVVDGIERPPLATDAERWRRIAIDDRWALVRLMTDAPKRYARATDEIKHTLTLQAGDDTPTTFRYTFPTPTTLVLDATHLHVELHTRDLHSYLLVSRGFHWIQELPFNR